MKQQKNETLIHICEQMGEAIRRARKLKGLTIDTVAEMVGVQKGTISRIETGKSNLSNTVLNLLVAVGVEPKDFFKFVIPEPSPERGLLELGDVIKTSRLRAGMTIAEASDASGLHSGHISSMEHDRVNVSFDDLESFSDNVHGLQFSLNGSDYQLFSAQAVIEAVEGNAKEDEIKLTSELLGLSPHVHRGIWKLHTTRRDVFAKVINDLGYKLTISC